MGKVLCKEKYQTLLGFIQLVHLYETILHDIERMGLQITEEKDRSGQPNYGGITSEILWDYLNLEEGLLKLGWEVQGITDRKFVRKQYNKKKEIIPKKVIVDEENDVLCEILNHGE